MNDFETETMADLAFAHHAYIPIFEKYGLDFCCRGRQTLKYVCTQNNVALNKIVNEMQEAAITESKQMPFTEMTVEQLISYIITHHHYYVKNNLSSIYGHIEKVVTQHGNHYPHMPIILNLFMAVTEELLPHMEKEEKILFPRIIEISLQNTNLTHVNLKQGFLDKPIMMMEKEHDRVGQLLFEIRELANHYIPPDDACTTHSICLGELKRFEEDFHYHVHLENNVLFPLVKNIR